MFFFFRKEGKRTIMLQPAGEEAKDHPKAVGEDGITSGSL
jgi:hypothetical protein